MIPSKHINPRYNKKVQQEVSLEEYKVGIEQRDNLLLARLISLCESTLEEDRTTIANLLSTVSISKRSKIIGISGAPGVGKSSFIGHIGKYLVDNGYSVAVLPVDPSSSVSHGSILGDKTRMGDLSVLNQVLIKPMSSSLSLGGVAPGTYAASQLCEAAGFDYILIETVGVGQSEHAIADIVDLFVLLLQPGAGDDLQGIKRGIMELADLFVVTKADGPQRNLAVNTQKRYLDALRLLQSSRVTIKNPILLSTITTDEYVKDFYQSVHSFFNNNSEEIKARRGINSIRIFHSQLREVLLQKLLEQRGSSEDLSTIEEVLMVDPYKLHQYISKFS